MLCVVLSRIVGFCVIRGLVFWVCVILLSVVVLLFDVCGLLLRALLRLIVL